MALSRSKMSLLLKFGRSSRQLLSYTRLICHMPAKVQLSKTKSTNLSVFQKSTDAKASQPRTDKIQLIAPSLRKSSRRRRTLTAMCRKAENLLPKVVGMARAESYDLCAIFEDENFCNFYQVTFVDEDSEDALHIVKRSEYRITNSVTDAFVFSDGVVVAWNFNDEELSQLSESLSPFEIDSYDLKLIQQETETISFNYTSGSRVSIKDDIVNLSKSDDSSTNVDVLGRFAVSHGLAASVKIAIWEQQLNDYAGPLYETTKFLIRGSILWRRRESLQKTGEFAALRQSINLDSNLLNTDFYWERDNLERHYIVTKKYFIVDKRLRELNLRLDYCQQFVSIIDDMLTHRHSARLEWLIIWLIVIEVVFDLLHYFDSAARPASTANAPLSVPESSPDTEQP